MTAPGRGTACYAAANQPRSFVTALAIAGALVLPGLLAAAAAHIFVSDPGWHGERGLAAFPIACFCVIAPCAAYAGFRGAVWKSVLVACGAFGLLLFFLAWAGSS